MQDTFPFVDQITIPIDAGTGSRVFIGVIGGDGTIQIYDTNNNLVGEWDRSELRIIEPSSGDEVRLVPAIMPFGLAANHVAILFNDDIIYRGNLNNLLVVSNTTDGISRLVQEGPPGNFEGVPRGIIKSVFSTSAGPVLTATTSGLYQLQNVPVVAGETYAVHFHGQAAMSAGGGAWAVELRINGAVHDTYDVINVAGTRVIDSTVYWEPSTTQSTDDLDVRCNELVNGSTLQIQGSATVQIKHTLINLSSET